MKLKKITCILHYIIIWGCIILTLVLSPVLVYSNNVFLYHLPICLGVIGTTMAISDLIKSIRSRKKNK